MKKLQIVYALNLHGKQFFLEELSRLTESTVVNPRILIKTKLANENDRLTLQIKESFEKGELIKSELLNELVIKEIEVHAEDTILVNYPKTIEEYNSFSEMIKIKGYEIDQYWYLTIADINLITKIEFDNMEPIYKDKMQINIDYLVQQNKERLTILDNSVQKLSNEFEFNVITVYTDQEYNLKQKIKSA